MPSPDPEAVASLFHETYERLAPDFHYETRRESAVPWDDLPDQNRLLMVAVARKVLAYLSAWTDERWLAWSRGTSDLTLALSESNAALAARLQARQRVEDVLMREGIAALEALHAQPSGSYASEIEEAIAFAVRGLRAAANVRAVPMPQ